MDMTEESHELGNRVEFFPKQGLSRLCDMVPFSELKTIRLVCQSFNSVVIWHPRFHSCQVTMNSDWVKKTKGFRLDFLTNWKHLTLRYFPLHRNEFFKRYWPYAGVTISTLNLVGLKVNCMELAKIINVAIRVETVKFDQIEFDNQKDIRVGEPVPEGNAEQFVPTELNPIHQVYCIHANFDGKAGPRTIKSITIYKVISFPLCILDLLEKRSVGVLETFCFDGNTEGTTKELVHPGMAEFQDYLNRICQGSAQTLKTISWTRNQKNGNVISTLAANTEIRLDKLSIALNPVQLGRGDFDMPAQIPQDPSLTALLRRQTNIVELNLAIDISGGTLEDLGEILPSLLNLEKMVLQVDNMDRNGPRALNIFSRCFSLRDLTVVDDSFAWSRQPRWQIHGAWHGVNLDHLANLPLSIRSLTCGHSFRHEPIMRAVFTIPTFLELTKLMILDGAKITDGIFQVIITNLTRLEEMTIRTATRVTDGGITGLDRLACKHVFKCMRLHGFQISEEQRPGQGHCLREMTNLRVLDLSNCPGLSDVSLFYAFRFPRLQKLMLNTCIRVGDIGIGWLGVQNPNLKELEVKGCPGVTHLGLNRLINVAQKIRRIRAKGNCCKSPTIPGQYTEHKLFKEIVYTKKSKEERKDQPLKLFRNPTTINFLI